MKNILAFIQNYQQADDQKRPAILTFLLPVISLVVVIILLFTVVIPQVMGYFKVNADISDLRLQTAALTSKAGVLQQVSTSDYQTQLNTVMLALPVERDYVTVAAQLQQIAQQSGLALTNMTFGDSAIQNSYQVKAEVTGTFPSIRTFVQKVDSAPRVMKVSLIDVSPDKLPLYVGNITILAYFFPTSTQTPAVDQPVVSLTESDLQLIQQISTAFAGSASTNTKPAGAGKTDPFQ